MARPKSVADHGLLEAALEGLELQRQRIEEQIRQVRARLGQGGGGRGRPAGKQAAATKSARPRRKLSEQARKRIAAAQKKRWAAFRKKAAQGASS